MAAPDTPYITLPDASGRAYKVRAHLGADGIYTMAGQGTIAGAKAVTPNNGVDLPDGTANGLWITTAGTLKMTLASGDVITITIPSDGYQLDFQVARVWATGTGATGIIALY